ncbi:hypothetical protein [Saccharopolyspora griseoalba]|uniref:Uncharacterized protein n=1 Tax=Saccharopolyspora griseoalba TaxID=1431848 RepID=A0ABW2LHR5_9PSEU
MAIDTNAVVNLPGLDDQKMDDLIALRAACQVTGAPTEWRDAKPYTHEFERWLRASKDNADRLVRRYVLLVVTEGRSTLGNSESDAGDVARLVEEFYRKIG